MDAVLDDMEVGAGGFEGIGLRRREHQLAPRVQGEDGRLHLLEDRLDPRDAVATDRTGPGPLYRAARPFSREATRGTPAIGRPDGYQSAGRRKAGTRPSRARCRR